jgi:hypothetical protein
MLFAVNEENKASLIASGMHLESEDVIPNEVRDLFQIRFFGFASE